MYRRPAGYSVVTDGWGVETRQDTAKCNHCQKVMFVEAGKDPNEFFCRKCYAPICPQCANKPCEHWEAGLDRMEATEIWLKNKFEEKLARASRPVERAEILGAMARERFLKDAGITG